MRHIAYLGKRGLKGKVILMLVLLSALKMGLHGIKGS